MFARLRPLLRAAEAAAESSAAPGSIPSKLSLNFLLPHEAVVPPRSKVDLVTVPALSGLFGVLPGHVPTMAQLKPGVVSVQFGADNTVDWFVSGGFAVIHADSTLDITAAEAFKVSDLDADAVRKGLATAQQELATAQSDVDKARAGVALEVYEAMALAMNVPRA